jgi:hypothetical protein
VVLVDGRRLLVRVCARTAAECVDRATVLAQVMEQLPSVSDVRKAQTLNLLMFAFWGWLTDGAIRSLFTVERSGGGALFASVVILWGIWMVVKAWMNMYNLSMLAFFASEAEVKEKS